MFVLGSQFPELSNFNNCSLYVLNHHKFLLRNVPEAIEYRTLRIVV